MGPVVDQRGLPCGPDAVLRRRQPDEPRLRGLRQPAGVEHRPAGARACVGHRADRQAGVLAGRAHGRRRSEVAAARDLRVGRERRRRVHHLAVAHADRDQAVTTRGQRAEALAQQHGAAVADRRRADELEVARRRGADAEQPPVARDPLAGGDLGIAGQTARHHAVGRRQRVRRAEAVPRRPQALARDQRALPRGRRLAARAGVEVRVCAFLPLEARRRVGTAHHDAQDDEHRPAHSQT